MLATGEGRELAELPPWLAAAPPSPGDLTAGGVAPAGITHRSSGDQRGDQTPESRQASRSLRVRALLSCWVRRCRGDRVRCHGPASPPCLARSLHSRNPKRQGLRWNSETLSGSASPRGLTGWSDLPTSGASQGRSLTACLPASWSACLAQLLSHNPKRLGLGLTGSGCCLGLSRESRGRSVEPDWGDSRAGN